MAKSKTKDEGARAYPTFKQSEPEAEPAEERFEVEPDAPARAPVKALPSAAITLTAKRCLHPRSSDPVVAAFLAQESQRGTRKLTREDWIAELETFTQAPR